MLNPVLCSTVPHSVVKKISGTKSDVGDEKLAVNLVWSDGAVCREGQ